MHISQLIAADAVRQVLSGRNLSNALSSALALFPEANPQQRGAAADLSYGTLRFYGKIQYCLSQLLQKPLTDARIHALLAVALYQLLYDKADAFTVVNQAVHAVTRLKRPAPKSWAKGLVNAVLRNFLREQADLEQQVALHASAAYSYPQWWINQLKKQYPDYWESMLQSGNQHPPLTLRINLRKTSVTDYLNLLAAQGLEAQHIGGLAVQLMKPIAVEKIPGFNEGMVSVQDYGAQMAAPLLDMQPGMCVLDACAAPGGKTGHILESCDVALTAIDSDEERLKRVASNLQRLQLNARLILGDAASTDWFDGQPFDRILADVPCTASGIVRRHVDIKWLRREADIRAFCAQQAKILPNLWQLLAKGGKLLYVTCSVFNEENQDQVNQFLSSHSDAQQLPLPQHAFPQTMTRLQGQLIPTIVHDGFFYALLQKN